MKNRREIICLVIAVTLCAALAPSAVYANCSDDLRTAVFVVDGILSDSDPEIRTLEVAPVGTVTNPDIAEMVEILQGVEPALLPPHDFAHVAGEGSFQLFAAMPGDQGASAIVDGRDGRVLFYGTVVWLGFGEVLLPYESSHDWQHSAGDPADPPASVAILPNGNWNATNGDPADLTDGVLTYLRETDVIHSFAACGGYDVVSYIYTPIGNPGVDPETASMIVVVSGYCDEPWSGVVTSAPIPEATLGVSVSPNPFNPAARMTYVMPAAGPVRLEVVDLRGRLVATLVDETVPAGRNEVVWNGMSDAGRAMPSGVYLTRLQADGSVVSGRMTLAR